MALPIGTCLKVLLRRNVVSCRKGLKREFYETQVRFMGKSVSSNNWVKRQQSDPFVKQAREDNWRCRSAYKLLEIDDKHRLLFPGAAVIDCGAAPGSWSQVAVQRVNKERKTGNVVSIDLQQMDTIEGSVVLQGHDFTEASTQAKVKDIIQGHPANVVLSDMAPRSSGNKHLDHEVITQLCMSVLQFSSQVLAPGGCVVCKIWMGSQTNSLESLMKRMFKQVSIVKPKASRTDSAEVYLLGKELFLINEMSHNYRNR